MHKLDLMLMKVANPSLNPDHIFSPAVQMAKTTQNLNYPFPLYVGANICSVPVVSRLGARSTELNQEPAFY